MKSSRHTRKRIILLAALSVVAIGLVGADILAVLTAQPAVLDLGFTPDIRGSFLEVVRVNDETRAGAPTPAGRSGIQEGDRLLAARFDDSEWTALEGLRSWWDVLRLLNTHRSVELKIDPAITDDDDEAVVRFAITEDDRVSPMRWLVLGLSTLALATALLIGFGRPDSTLAFTASLLFLSVSSLFAQDTVLVPGLIEIKILYNLTFNALAAYLFMTFFLGFPSPSGLAARFPWLRFAGRFVVALHISFGLLAFAFLMDSFERYQSTLGGWPTQTFIGVTFAQIAMLLVGFVSLILNTIRAKGADERRRMAILLAGSIVGLLPMLIVGVLAYTVGPWNLPLWAIAIAVSLTACFPASFIYVVVRHRVLGFRLILRRGMQYALVSRGFLVAEALVLAGLFVTVVRPVLGRFLQQQSTGVLVIEGAALGFILFAVLRTVNRRIMPVIDRRFFREAYDTERILAGLSAQVRCCAGRPRELLDVLASTVGDALNVDRVAIFLTAPVNPIWSDTATARGEAGGFECCYARAHPESPDLIQSEADLDLPPDAPFSALLSRVDPGTPEILELYECHPELFRRPAGDRERSATVQRHQREVVEALNLRLVVPLTTSEEVIGFMALGEKLSEEAYTSRDHDLLLGVAGQAAVAIDYARMILDVAQNERLQHEIHLAGGVLETLLPTEPPALRGLELRHLILPAQEVAGDFLQYFPDSNGGISIVVGDVAGKGLRAAMVVTLALGGLEAIVQETRDPGAVMRRLNNLVMKRLGRDGFVTCIFAHFEPGTGKLALANAGHPYPLLSDPTRGDWVEVQATGPRLPLGVRRDLEYETTKLELAPDSRMVVMSDGVVEAPNPDGEQFGFDRIQALMAENSGGSDELISRLLGGVRRHMGDRAQQDDISLLILHRNSS